MANPYFQFKQFTIHHDRCAMKVGTDGVLLGAWAPVEEGMRVLDVGAGSGLIALMLAQRNAASVIAVELDEDAAAQAAENVAESPFADRVEVVQNDILHFQPEQRFDLIVSNPPYFDLSLQSPDKQRTLARHTDSLSYDDLLTVSARLLNDGGLISLVVPVDVEQKLDAIAQSAALFPVRKTFVIPKPGAAPKRLLVSYSNVQRELQQDELLVELARHHYSEEFISLTKAFYLKM
ncbi:tRNA1(Val) (adenine(37)-N6)-methyltransferase [Parabacteroides sp. FAFU027]|uniref:tRNA1(Val) (adenine(37)-N6)-methyltransferase n=1 Tax=Parabacteroides sp. FAFU027 TaxID=2922715 RepID=UPI001FAF011D|nr:methyltransferase [Parabacteroides sp. FAFU027]